MPDNLKSLASLNGPETIKIDQPESAAGVPAVNNTASIAGMVVNIGQPAAAELPADQAAVQPKSSDVYAMPKEFQHHNRVAGSNFGFWGAVVILASVVFLTVVGGGFYLYIFNPALLSSWTDKIFGVQNTPTLPEIAKNEPLAPAPTEANTQASSSLDTLPEQTPRQTYAAYIAALGQVNVFSDYYALISRYGDQRRLAAAAAERLVAEASPAAGSASLQTIKDKVSLVSSSNITEEINGQQALLRITSLDGQATGTIALALENTVWKISQEDWAIAEKKTAVISYTLGADRDNDGLTDAEENLLGSNKDSADSDNDGFGDLKEVLNLYNPLGKDKLVDNPRIKSYLADDQSFYFLYPSVWTRVNDKGSPIFTSANGHFIQLIVADNDNNESLDAYAARVLNMPAVAVDQQQSAETWNGLMSADGLNIYMMGAKKDKIYVLHYGPGSGVILEYPNIFQAVIKSFVIKK